MDECTENEHVCGVHAACLNREGTYDCVCDGGYRMDDGRCVGMEGGEGNTMSRYQ